MLIGGEGGMGKSTLSAKIIRCLYQEQAVDLILGDSAKSEHVNPATGEIVKYQPGYYDLMSFYSRLCNQLGLPNLPRRQAIEAVKDRLIGRKAIIVVDNRETVEKGDEVQDSIKKITSRDVRAIVTTRKVTGVKVLSDDLFVVQLRPLTDARMAGLSCVVASQHALITRSNHIEPSRPQDIRNQDGNVFIQVERCEEFQRLIAGCTS